jgi:chitinase
MAPPTSGSGGGETEAPTLTSLIPSQDYRMLDYRVVDAEYSKSLDRIVMVSSEPNEIHVYNPMTGTNDVVQSLPLSPSCVSVGPDGKAAAVGHNGWVSYVDLTATTTSEESVQTLLVATDVFDIVLARNGYIYAFPRADQWVNIHSIEIATGIETTHEGFPIRERTRVKLHPSGTKIYGADNGLSPSDFERYDIAGGAAEYEYDSPYHGDYPIDGDLWISEDGGRIFVRGRSVFRSSDNRDMDMIYAGKLDLGLGQVGLSTIQSLDHSSRQGKILAIPSFRESWQYGGEGEDDSTASSDDQIEIYEESFLGHISTLTLPKFLGNNGARHEPHGKFIFFDSTGERFHVIAQADADAGMLYDYATISIPTNITDTMSI